MQLKSDTAQVAVSVGASSLGYFVGKDNPEKIDKWLEWTDRLLQIETGTSALSYEQLLAEGFNHVIDEPYLELQFGKLIKLLEFPELQPPELPFLTNEYVNYIKGIISDFHDGLMAASKE